MGVGTNDPTEKLHLYGGNLQLNRNPTDGAIFLASPDQYIFGDTVNGRITFGTNDSERLVILNSGNVGIGSNNPTSQLSIVGDGDILLEDSGTSDPYIRFSNSTNIIIIGHIFGDVSRNNFVLRHGNVPGDDQLVLGSNGAIGINSPTPWNSKIDLINDAP